MIIIKEVKQVSNFFRTNIVVEYLESIPTNQYPEVLKAQRISKLTYEEALKTIGTGLNGIIIQAQCSTYQYLPVGRTDPHAHSSSYTRFVYVEHGDDIRFLSGPMLSFEEYGALSDTTWDWM